MWFDRRHPRRKPLASTARVRQSDAVARQRHGAHDITRLRSRLRRHPSRCVRSSRFSLRTAPAPSDLPEKIAHMSSGRVKSNSTSDGELGRICSQRESLTIAVLMILASSGWLGSIVSADCLNRSIASWNDSRSSSASPSLRASAANVGLVNTIAER